MKKTLQHILISVSIILLSGFLMNAMSVKKEDNNIFERAEAELASPLTTEETPLNHKEDFFNNYRTYAIDLPEKLDFAGEKVPMDDPDVYERLDREFLVNVYWQSNSLLLFKRSNK